MNPRPDPDRLIHAFLMEGPTELADEVYVTVRDRIEHSRQRAVIGLWREPDVNPYLKIALAVAAVVVVAVVGFRQFSGNDVVSPGSSASPGPTATPSVTATSAAPPLTETFTSARNGITLSHPNGWVARPATESWTTSVPDFMAPGGDVVYDPTRTTNLWISVASQPIGDTAPDAWAADTIAIDDGCTATEPIAVDGASGLIGTGDCTRATVTTGGRGYFIWLYTSGDEAALSVYDRAWFEDVLATVRLQPGDAGSAPPLTETFTSARNGITLSYPNGWVARPATESWTTSVPDFMAPGGDVVSDPVREANLWISVASQPIGDTAPDAWAADTIAIDDGCTATEPIAVDGASGLIGTGDCTRATVTTGGRGYFIWLYTSGDEAALSVYDRAWFEDVLATVRLQPGDAAT